MKKEDGFTTLRTFGDPAEARMTKALLDSAGIESFISGEVASSVLPFLVETFGIELVVRSEDATRAEQFLKAEIEK